MRAHEEGAPRLGAFGGLEKAGEGVEGFVITGPYAARAVPDSEVEHHAGGVIREKAVLLAGLQEGVPDEHVTEEGERRMRPARRPDEGGQERRIVEQRIQPLLA